MAPPNRVLLSAIVTDVLDSTVTYPACIQCCAKLEQNRNGNIKWSCPKCRRRYQQEAVNHRYRLSISVCDRRSYFDITSFGAMLNLVFGVSANVFYQKYLSRLELTFGIRYSAVIKAALERVLLGQSFIFGLKLPVLTKNLPTTTTYASQACQSVFNSSQMPGSVNNTEQQKYIATQMLPHSTVKLPTTVVQVIDYIESRLERDETNLAALDEMEVVNLLNSYLISFREGHSQSVTEDKWEDTRTLNCSDVSSDCSGWTLGLSCEISSTNTFNSTQEETSKSEKKRTQTSASGCSTHRSNSRFNNRQVLDSNFYMDNTRLSSKPSFAHSKHIKKETCIKNNTKTYVLGTPVLRRSERVSKLRQSGCQEKENVPSILKAWNHSQNAFHSRNIDSHVKLLENKGQNEQKCIDNSACVSHLTKGRRGAKRKLWTKRNLTWSISSCLRQNEKERCCGDLRSSLCADSEEGMKERRDISNVTAAVLSKCDESRLTDICKQARNKSCFYFPCSAVIARSCNDRHADMTPQALNSSVHVLSESLAVSQDRLTADKTSSLSDSIPEFLSNSADFDSEFTINEPEGLPDLSKSDPEKCGGKPSHQLENEPMETICCKHEETDMPESEEFDIFLATSSGCSITPLENHSEKLKPVNGGDWNCVSINLGQCENEGTDDIPGSDDRELCPVANANGSVDLCVYQSSFPHGQMVRSVISEADVSEFIITEDCAQEISVNVTVPKSRRLKTKTRKDSNMTSGDQTTNIALSDTVGKGFIINDSSVFGDETEISSSIPMNNRSSISSLTVSEHVFSSKKIEKVGEFCVPQFCQIKKFRSEKSGEHFSQALQQNGVSNTDESSNISTSINIYSYCDEEDAPESEDLWTCLENPLASSVVSNPLQTESERKTVEKWPPLFHGGIEFEYTETSKVASPQYPVVAKEIVTKGLRNSTVKVKSSSYSKENLQEVPGLLSSINGELTTTDVDGGSNSLNRNIAKSNVQCRDIHDCTNLFIVSMEETCISPAACKISMEEISNEQVVVTSPTSTSSGTFQASPNSSGVNVMCLSFTKYPKICECLSPVNYTRRQSIQSSSDQVSEWFSLQPTNQFDTSLHSSTPTLISSSQHSQYVWQDASPSPLQNDSFDLFESLENPRTPAVTSPPSGYNKLMECFGNVNNVTDASTSGYNKLTECFGNVNVTDCSPSLFSHSASSDCSMGSLEATFDTSQHSNQPERLRFGLRKVCFTQTKQEHVFFKSQAAAACRRSMFKSSPVVTREFKSCLKTKIKSNQSRESLYSQDLFDDSCVSSPVAENPQTNTWGNSQSVHNTSESIILFSQDCLDSKSFTLQPCVHKDIESQTHHSEIHHDPLDDENMPIVVNGPNMTYSDYVNTLPVVSGPNRTCHESVNTLPVVNGPNRTYSDYVNTLPVISGTRYESVNTLPVVSLVSHADISMNASQDLFL